MLDRGRRHRRFADVRPPAPGDRISADLREPGASAGRVDGPLTAFWPGERTATLRDLSSPFCVETSRRTRAHERPRIRARSVPSQRPLGRRRRFGDVTGTRTPRPKTRPSTALRKRTPPSRTVLYPSLLTKISSGVRGQTAPGPAARPARPPISRPRRGSAKSISRASRPPRPSPRNPASGPSCG